jgi:uncharacterized phage protein gp47/JayE
LLFRNEAPIVGWAGGVASDVVFVAQNTGAIDVPTGTLTVIATPVPGWNSVTNPADGVPGANVETDAELRARRLVFSEGSALERDERVKKLFVLENVTDTVDSNGLPPHSFEAIVYDGTDTGTVLDDATIAALVWRDKPAGIATHGDTTETTPDANGDLQTVRFSRPTVLRLYVEVDVTKGPGWHDTHSPTAIAEALAAYSRTAWTCGSPVVQAFLYAPITAIPGVADVTAIRFDATALPTNTATIVTGPKEIPRIDTADVDVTASS